MANSVDPDQTAPIGAVCSGSTLFASILNSSVMLGNYLKQMTSADDIFRCIFCVLEGLSCRSNRDFQNRTAYGQLKLLSLRLLGNNFACFFLSSAIFFKNLLFLKNSFRNTIRVSNSLDPDQAQHFAGPDLGPNCFQRLSTDDAR